MLEQETCNEQVGFKGHRGGGNSTKVGDVPCSFIDLRQKLCTPNTSKSVPLLVYNTSAERQCLGKVGDEIETLHKIPP